MIRTGKLTGNTKILLPYYDTDGMRQYQMINITGTMYASKMYAGIRKFVLDNWNLKVDKDWLHNVPIIANSNDPEVVAAMAEPDKMIEAFIEAIEEKDDPTENSTDTGSQTEATA